MNPDGAVRSASEWRAVLAEVDQAGLCAHPVRLRGVSLDRSTGELADGALLVPCKDRRAAVCPSCSRLYQADAWQLVAAGIRGGKGVSPDVAGHPQLFVTLTAPSLRSCASDGPRGRATSLSTSAQRRQLPPRSTAFLHAPPRQGRPSRSASRCAQSASTTGAPCCGTPTCPGSGAGRAIASTARSPGPAA